MKDFPLTVVDNFFDNPDEIREYGLSQEYPVSSGKYPGKRTKELLDIDQELYIKIMSRVMKLFTESNQIGIDAIVQFQQIPNDFKDAFVHEDTGMITFIVYLDKNPSKNTGTSFYELNDGMEIMDSEIIREKKHKSILNGDYDTFHELAKENNSRYTETMSVQAKYNRMVLFDGEILHRAQGFDSSDSDRLTLVGFIKEYQIPSTPLGRIKNQ